MATIDKRYVVVLGPIKAEITDLSSVSDQDTYSSLLQNPLFGMAGEQGDQNSTASVAVSGKTVTIHNNTGTDVTAIVFGF